jgi:hypothetical protein
LGGHRIPSGARRCRMRIEGLYRPEVVTADAGESLTAVA